MTRTARARSRAESMPTHAAAPSGAAASLPEPWPSARRRPTWRHPSPRCSRSVSSTRSARPGPGSTTSPAPTRLAGRSGRRPPAGGQGRPRPRWTGPGRGVPRLPDDLVVRAAGGRPARTAGGRRGSAAAGPRRRRRAGRHRVAGPAGGLPRAARGRTTRQRRSRSRAVSPTTARALGRTVGGRCTGPRPGSRCRRPRHPLVLALVGRTDQPTEAGSLSALVRSTLSALDSRPLVTDAVAELRRPVAGCLVNHDLKWDNVVLTGPAQQPVLLDWELAGLGDPAWDLGCLLAEHLVRDGDAGSMTPPGPCWPATGTGRGCVPSIVATFARRVVLAAGLRVVQLALEVAYTPYAGDGEAVARLTERAEAVLAAARAPDRGGHRMPLVNAPGQSWTCSRDYRSPHPGGRGPGRRPRSAGPDRRGSPGPRAAGPDRRRTGSRGGPGRLALRRLVVRSGRPARAGADRPGRRRPRCRSAGGRPANGRADLGRVAGAGRGRGRPASPPGRPGVDSAPSPTPWSDHRDPAGPRDRGIWSPCSTAARASTRRVRGGGRTPTDRKIWPRWRSTAGTCTSATWRARARSYRCCCRWPPRPGAPLSLKCPPVAQGYGRRDALVAYLPRQHASRAEAALRRRAIGSARCSHPRCRPAPVGWCRGSPRPRTPEHAGDQLRPAALQSGGRPGGPARGTPVSDRSLTAALAELGLDVHAIEKVLHDRDTVFAPPATADTEYAAAARHLADRLQSLAASGPDGAPVWSGDDVDPVRSTGQRVVLTHGRLDDGLLTGRTGIAAALALCARLPGGRPEWSDLASRAVRSAVRSALDAAPAPGGLGWSSGWLGTARAAGLVGRWTGDGALVEAGRSLAGRAVRTLADEPGWCPDYPDLLDGWAGHLAAVLAADARPRPRADPSDAAARPARTAAPVRRRRPHGPRRSGELADGRERSGGDRPGPRRVRHHDRAGRRPSGRPRGRRARWRH